MADKEERISVIVYEKDPCENCPGKPMTDCQVCEKDLRYDGGMTRQEAIERMARAIHFYERWYHNNMPKWEELNSDTQNDYSNMAMTALNALLAEVEDAKH